jgi:DNA repair exonuclease SbcCD nuclease subunit
MVEAGETNPDMVALTGDIIHFPSQACLDHATASVNLLDMPVLYTSGDHDWHFPGGEGRAALKDTCRPLLKPLHN